MLQINSKDTLASIVQGWLEGLEVMRKMGCVLTASERMFGVVRDTHQNFAPKISIEELHSGTVRRADHKNCDNSSEKDAVRVINNILQELNNEFDLTNMSIEQANEHLKKMSCGRSIHKSPTLSPTRSYQQGGLQSYSSQ